MAPAGAVQTRFQVHVDVAVLGHPGSRVAGLRRELRDRKLRVVMEVVDESHAGLAMTVADAETHHR